MSGLKNTTDNRSAGFTIVELLIVVVVIAVLAAITVVAYNGMTNRATNSKRDSDTATYYKAILMARQSTGLALRYITNNAWSTGSCAVSSGNPANTEPRDLPKTHACWTRYYDNLDRIGAAAGINLDNLKSGDYRGNPYTLDENEGESCGSDQMYVFTGNGATYQAIRVIPRLVEC